MSLVAHLMKRNGCSYTKALALAQAIGDNRRKKIEQLKIAAGKAQMTLAFAGPSADEPLNPSDVIDPTITF